MKESKVLISESDFWAERHAKTKKLEKTEIITIIQTVKVLVILLSEMSIADTCSLTYIEKIYK